MNRIFPRLPVLVVMLAVANCNAGGMETDATADRLIRLSMSSNFVGESYLWSVRGVPEDLVDEVAACALPRARRIFSEPYVPPYPDPELLSFAEAIAVVDDRVSGRQHPGLTANQIALRDDSARKMMVSLRDATHACVAELVPIGGN